MPRTTARFSRYSPLLGLLLALAATPLHAQGDYRDCQQTDLQQRTQCIQKTLTFTSEQYHKVARGICMRIDRFKQSSAQAFEIRDKMCPAVPSLCKGGSKYLDMRGVVRVTVAQGLRLSDPNVIEAILPAVLSELLTYSCDVVSAYALSDVPFHQQKRNYAKRAIFTGQTSDMFNQFLFNDYGYDLTDGKAVAWDINAVEMVDGEPETLLDYVDKILVPEHPIFLGEEQRGNVESIRDAFISIGAVNARNLDCEPGQKTWCNVSKTYRDWEARAEQRKACRKECYPKKSDVPSHIKVPPASATWEERRQEYAEFGEWYWPRVERCDQQCDDADPQP